jgi:hypothetical protein
VLELARSLLANSFQGIVVLCIFGYRSLANSSDCCSRRLLFSGGMPKRGGVGLAKCLVGGVKECCQNNTGQVKHEPRGMEAPCETN